MPLDLINLGAAPDDRTGDTFRAGGEKINAQMTELFANFDAIKVIYISQESDFPTQDASTITLEEGLLYFATGSFSTGKRFICEDGSSITALNQFGVVITYTGTGNMFSGTDVNWKIQDIGLDCPNGGQYFNFADTVILNTHIFWCTHVIGLTCGKFGTLTSLASFVITDTSVTGDASDGLSVFGASWRVWRMQNAGFLTTSPTFIGVDLGTATASAVGIGPMVVVGGGGVGTVGISGLANSGNIIAGNLGRVDQTNYIGNVTPLSGLTNEDIRWQFSGNDIIPDTIVDAMVSLNSNTTETIIATINTPVLAAGTWTCERGALYSCTTAGRVTLDSERDVVTPVDIAITIEAASGTNIDVTAYVALNGTVIANSAKSNKVGGSDPRSISVLWQLNLTTGDYLELFVENNSGTTNLIVTSAILRAR